MTGTVEHGLRSTPETQMTGGVPTAWCLCGDGFRADTIGEARAAVAVHVQKAEDLRGPWRAILADQIGFVYEDVADAVANADDPDGELFSVSVVRASALPNDRSGCRLRLPGTIRSGDRVFDLDDLYLVDEGDGSVAAGARLTQAKAMAAGLNRAWQKVDRLPGGPS